GTVNTGTVNTGTVNTGTAGVSPAARNASLQDSAKTTAVAFNAGGRDARGPSIGSPSIGGLGLRRALWLGLVCGVALLTKFSMLIIVPVVGVYFLARLLRNWRDRQRRSQVLIHSAAITAVVLFLVNAAYYFQHPVLDPSDVRWVQMKSPALLGFVTTGIRWLSKLIPTYYLFGVYNIELHNHYGHATSLLGQYNDLGWWYYFPLAFALKTTIPFLLLAVAALGWAVWKLLAKRDRRFIWLVVPVCIYLAISLTSHINIGIRHFLPVYPFLFIAGGALLARLLEARRTVGIAVLILLLGW